MQIGIWGDSITYGSCDSAGLGWVGRYRKTFEAGDYIGVYNRGVSGDTTNDLVLRFKIEAESIKPTKIIFAIGINDSKYLDGETDNKVPFEKFSSNIQLLLKQAQEFTQDITFIGPTVVDESAKRHRGTKFVNTEIQRYRDEIKRITEENNLPFISVYDVLDPKADLFDGVHPNSKGYDKLFEEITKGLK